MRNHDKIQQEVFLYFWNSKPETRGLLFGNNSNPKNSVHGAELKGLGLVKGRPDMELHWLGKTYFFEIKYDKDVLKKEQKSVIEKLTEHGFTCYVCYSAIGMIELINEIICKK